jgi:DNA-binding transcriptional ArsR family regulator
MADDEDPSNQGNDAEITVTAPSLEDIAGAIDAEFVEEEPEQEADETGLLGGFDELEPAIERMVEVYEGLVKATELDERGIMRHKVQELAGLEDMDRDAFGHHLRSLEHHGLAKQDGNRWSAPLTVEEDE